MEQINKQTFQQKLKSYRKSPLSLTLFLLVTISALVTAFVLFFLIAYILIKGVPHLTLDLFSWTYNSENVSMLPSIVNTFLEMHRPILFNELVLSDKLFEHCAEIDETARNRMELIVRSLAEQNDVTEQLKAENQMEWVRQMNACKAQAEEIVKAELIYD